MSGLTQSTRLAVSVGLVGMVMATWACSFSGTDGTPLIDTATSTPPPALLLVDEFSADQGDWTTGDDEVSTIAYRDGALDFVMKTEQFLTWSNLASERFEDVRITVDVLDRSDTDQVGYAVICNYRDSANFYYAAISKDGFYIISKFDDDEETVLSSPEGEWIESRAINAGQSQYTLAVACAHGQISLTVDGVEVATVEDATFARGEIGLMGISFKEIDLEFGFDNVRVETVTQEE